MDILGLYRIASYCIVLYRYKFNPIPTLIPIPSTGSFFHNNNVVPKVRQDRPHQIAHFRVGIENGLVELGDHRSGRKTAQRSALLGGGAGGKFPGAVHKFPFPRGNHFHDDLGLAR